MRILKSHPLASLANGYVIDSPQPSNLSYLWNFGSLLAFCLVIQIVTGVTLAMHYNASVLEAFNSVEHIMRDVNNGWLIRYLHSNTASAFFFIVYLHIGRGLYYGSYRAPRTLVWTIGTVIFILMMATAFLGFLHSPIRISTSIYTTLSIIFLSIILFLVKGSSKDNNVKQHNMSTRRKYKCNMANMANMANVPVKNNKLGLNLKRHYSTNKSTGNENKHSISDRLNDIIKQLNINPEYVFDNVNLITSKDKILKDTKGLSGVYMIINKTTKDYYVGSAASDKFYARFSNHLIYFRGSKIVKAAVKKYGIENFAFVVLELYPNIVTKENNHELLHLEDKYLKLLLPNYNILTEAGSSFGYKHTEIDRKKMIDNYSDERREKIGNLNRGRKFSTETIERMREKALLRPPMSKETKIKCISNSKPVTLLNLDRTVYGKYPSILDASKAINCNEKTVRRALLTDKKLVKRQWIVKLV